MQRFGVRERFAVEVGDWWSAQLRYVDLWAGGVYLTRKDNCAFVPSFIHMMRATVAEVRDRTIEPGPCPGRSPQVIHRKLRGNRTGRHERWWFMEWGETVDNVSKYAYADGDDLVLVFTLRPDPQVFTARLPMDEFADVVEAAADFLSPPELLGARESLGPLEPLGPPEP
jgi:hypothetical protein